MTRSPSAAPRTLPILFFGVLTAALDIALVATTLPAIRAAFQVDERSASWILGTFVLFTLLGLPVMTKLSDRYGRRRIYALDLGLFVLGGLVVISSTAYPQFLFGRALQGLGASGIFPVASAVIGDTIAPERRGRTLGILGSVYGLAFIVGPILGGILVQSGWQWPFVANLILGALVLLFGTRRVPNLRTETKRPLDWKGILILMLLLGTLSMGMNHLNTSALLQSVTSPVVWPLFLLSFSLIPAFVLVERRAQDPLLRIGLISRRQVALVCLFATGAGLVEAAFVFMTDFATEALDVSQRTASFMLLPLVVSVTIASPLAGRLLDRVGSRTIIASGSVLTAAGMALLGGLPPSAAVFYGGSVAIGMGLACLLGSSLSYILLAEAEVTERTVAQGINTLFISIGQLLGSALIGAVAASASAPAIGYRQAFWVLAVVMAGLFASSLLLKSRRAEQEQLIVPE